MGAGGEQKPAVGGGVAADAVDVRGIGHGAVDHRAGDWRGCGVATADRDDGDSRQWHLYMPAMRSLTVHWFGLSAHDGIEQHVHRAVHHGRQDGRSADGFRHDDGDGSR